MPWGICKKCGGDVLLKPGEKRDICTVCLQLLAQKTPKPRKSLLRR